MGKSSPEALEHLGAHLHIHFEPESRKRRKLHDGHVSSVGGSSVFFETHSLDNPRRLRLSLDDLQDFAYDIHREQRREDVDYFEMRFSPRRFMVDGAELLDTLALADRVASAVSEPTMRLILLLNRDSPPAYIGQIEEVIETGLPDTFVGIDLAGDEREFVDDSRFVRCFERARRAGLGATIHAGEFGPEANVWSAIDNLGATRIGHGLATRGSQALLRRLIEDDVMLEISLASNLKLQAVESLERHPLPWFLDKGVAISLNADLPVYLGNSLSMEYTLAEQLLESGTGWPEEVRDDARRHAFARSSDKMNG